MRCQWCMKDDLYMHYHDTEWGVPVYDDRTMFEFLILETFQAGLSWYTILKKRENFRKAFLQFHPEKMAAMNDQSVALLMDDTGIIRNRAKIQAAINNAQLFLKIAEKESFTDYMWKFTDGKILVNQPKKLSEIQATSKESDRMSAEMRKLGFKFVGSTVCYAHMQATGMVNDHLTDCFRYSELLAETR